LAPWPESLAKPLRIVRPTRLRNRLCCRTGYIRTCSAAPAKSSVSRFRHDTGGHLAGVTPPAEPAVDDGLTREGAQATVACGETWGFLDQRQVRVP
jgi:hypothetical protein